MKNKAGLAAHALAVFGALIFLDSLRYKFTDHENTRTIFGTLDAWAGSNGADGLFAHAGLFSQYVIGAGELVAAVFLLAGILPRFRRLQAVGALKAFAIMSGALYFHLATPLGIDPNNDGGGLFVAAVLLWLGSLLIMGIRRRELGAFLVDLKAAFLPR